MIDQELFDLILGHEGIRLKPYRCSSGKLTIGIGRNLDDKGITGSEAIELCYNDIREVTNGLRENLPYFDSLSKYRQHALIDMAFQMGVNGLLLFKKTLDLIEQGRFDEASQEALNSRWATQTPKRAAKVTQMIQEG